MRTKLFIVGLFSTFLIMPLAYADEHSSGEKGDTKKVESSTAAGKSSTQDITTSGDMNAFGKQYENLLKNVHARDNKSFKKNLDGFITFTNQSGIMTFDEMKNFLLFELVSYGTPEMLSLLIQKGVSIDEVDLSGNGMINMSIINALCPDGDLSMLSFMLDKGAKPTLKNNDGLDASGILKEKEEASAKILAILKDHEIESPRKDYPKTKDVRVIVNESEPLYEKLTYLATGIASGSDTHTFITAFNGEQIPDDMIDARFRNGQTLFLSAGSMGTPGIVTYLLHKYADFYAVDDDGNGVINSRIYSIYTRNADIYMLKILLEWDANPTVKNKSGKDARGIVEEVNDKIKAIKKLLDEYKEAKDNKNN